MPNRESLCDALLPVPLAPHTPRSATRRFMSLFTLSIFLFSIFWVSVRAAVARQYDGQTIDLSGQVMLGGSEAIAKQPDFSSYIDLAVLPKHTLRSKGGRLIFVGDIHGMHDSLEHLLRKVHFDAAHDTLVHAGDIIVKGPHSHKVLKKLMSLDAAGVRGNQDQKVVEWRGWIHWVLKHKGGKAWLAKMEKQVHGIKKGPTKGDYKHFRKVAASKGWKIPDGWEFGSDIYKLARHLKPKEYQYLLDLPIVLHIPSLHTIVVHAGILPMDPRHKMLSKHQPLSHPPKTKHNKTENVLRNMQERSLLSDIPQNTDPWSKLNMRSILDNGEVSREKEGTPWSDLWNKVVDLCDGFDAKSESVSDDGMFEAESGRRWSDWIDDELKGIRSLPCKGVTVVYGHAASVGLHLRKWSKGLDTGCVYNLRLTALVVGKRWRPMPTNAGDGDLLLEADEETEGEVVSYGHKGHAKVVQVRCSGGTSRLD